MTYEQAMQWLKRHGGSELRWGKATDAHWECVVGNVRGRPGFSRKVIIEGNDEESHRAAFAAAVESLKEDLDID